MSSVRLQVDREAKLISLDGAPIFGGSTVELTNEIDALQKTGRPALVVTPNVDQAITLADDGAFRRSFHSADLRILDGMPLVLLAKALGAKWARRHTGADLLFRVADVAADRAWRVAILGGDPKTGSDAAARLRHQFPGADIISVSFPFVSDVADDASLRPIEELARYEPHVVFVCLGAPKQELWFAEWKSHLPPAVFVGAGAAVDFAAGRARRAPRVVQDLGMEWAWRLAGEPRRLARRYILRGPRFLRIVARSLFAGRRRTRNLNSLGDSS